MSKTRFTTKQLTTAAVIAAVYAALTLLLPIPQYGGVQLRVAEAMTVLPFFFPEAIPGLAVGCFLANLLGSPFVLDWIFGTLATLAAAWLSSRAKKPWLVPLPPVALNAFIVAGVLAFTSQMPYWPWVLSIGAGQAVACYGLGYPLLLLLRRYPRLFGRQ